MQKCLGWQRNNATEQEHSPWVGWGCGALRAEHASCEQSSTLQPAKIPGDWQGVCLQRDPLAMAAPGCASGAQLPAALGETLSCFL